ncbi:MAG: alcohol dehydrogenase catalytic domain-containing protein, partial [Marmoricola sp.]
MKAVLTHGSHDLAVAEVPTPAAGAGQVRVRVAAASVNPVDVALDAGAFHEAGVVTGSGPIGLGWDLAGTVDAVGADVEGFAVGDRVAGLVPAMGVPLGALAEAAVLPAAALAHVPDELGLTEAAAVTLNGLTAHQAIALLDRTAPDRGSLLVTGGAGAVGGFVLELLLDSGWEVTALARESDAGFVTARGAKHVTDLSTAGRFDAVLDAAALQQIAAAAVRPGGVFVGGGGAAPQPESAGGAGRAVGGAPPCAPRRGPRE